MNPANLPVVDALIKLALAEDIERGDITTSAIMVGREKEHGVARVVAREELVVCGVEVARAVFHRIDGDVAVDILVDDGTVVVPGTEVIKLQGPVESILIGERICLNFLQRLSGVASLARRYADAVSGTSARVVDTRKTTPGFRALEKWAVRVGGCWNHRADLGSGILIKDNHIAACGSVKEAVTRARRGAPHSARIEVEIDDEAQLEEAIEARAEAVLLDNMGVEMVARAAARAHDAGLLVEVSGGVTLDTVRGYADAGADFISVGALTHSAPAVDLALDWGVNGAAEQS